ncbi:MAG: hypothetical protein R3C18_20065 [Planctomycetaceae bacterium]
MGSNSDTSWPGGPCPQCGEEMPPRMVRCRYCKFSLEESTDGNGGGSLESRTAQEVPAPSPTPPVKRPKQVSKKQSVSRPRAAPSAEPVPESNKAPAPERSTTGPANGNLPTSGAGLSLATGITIAVLLLLLAPLMVSGPVPGEPSPLVVTWPMVHSGDEPHNLVLLNSFLNDGDFDVANNYANVHHGKLDAGRKFAGWALDHHVTWYWQDYYINWWEAYEMDGAKWERDAAGHPIPTFQADSIHRPVSDREYSKHSPGLAILQAPFLFPFRGTSLLEGAALALTALTTFAGFWGLVVLIRPYVNAPWQAALTAAIAYLGSPLWHYGRTLYAEPIAATLLVCGYALVLRKDQYLIGGLLLGAMVLLKAPFLVLALPLFVDILWRRDWLNAVFLCLPSAAAIGLALLWNMQMRNGWFHTAQKFEAGNLFAGGFGLLFSPTHGLLLFAPLLFIVPLFLPEWFRKHKRDALLISSSIVSFFLLMSLYRNWWGGAVYSARYLVPMLPLLFVPMATIWTWDIKTQRRTLYVAFTALMLVSLCFSGIAAFSCEHVVSKHPLAALKSIFP